MQKAFNEYRAWFVLVIVLVLFFAVMPTTYTQAQETSTPTPTATLTPTATNTPIATPYPMIRSNIGFVQSVRCGAYGLTVTGGDCFQAQDAGNYSAYSAAGRETFRVTGETGDVNAYGIITATTLSLRTGGSFSGVIKYGTSATYTTGASITHGFATTPTMCILSPIEITATLTITSTGFSSNSATHTNPIYWMCGS